MADYLRDLGEQRAAEFREARAAGSLSRNQVGNVIALVIDRRTGAVYEGGNGPARDVIPDGRVHDLHSRSSNVRINIDDTDLDEASSYVYNGELFTGELVETDRAGHVLALTPVVRGRVHGIERTWHRNGALETETSVVNGVAVGTSRQWHPNGQLAEQLEFTDRGNLVAVRRWSEDGTALPS